MDRDLVEQAQAGDQSAFMALVRSRGDQLFAIAQRILRDVDRAEDALQDAGDRLVATDIEKVQPIIDSMRFTPGA